MSNKYLVYCNHLFSVMPNSNLANYKLTKSSVDIDKRKNKEKKHFSEKVKNRGNEMSPQAKKQIFAERVLS